MLAHYLLPSFIRHYQSNQVGDASDSEAEEGDKVVLPQAMRGRGNHASATAAVKLTELGPRITMKLFKVERGVCEGDVMYHALESRTPEQVRLFACSAATVETTIVVILVVLRGSSGISINHNSVSLG